MVACHVEKSLELSLNGVDYLGASHAARTHMPTSPPCSRRVLPWPWFPFLGNSKQVLCLRLNGDGDDLCNSHHPASAGGPQLPGDMSGATSGALLGRRKRKQPKHPVESLPMASGGNASDGKTCGCSLLFRKAQMRTNTAVCINRECGIAKLERLQIEKSRSQNILPSHTEPAEPHSPLAYRHSFNRPKVKRARNNMLNNQEPILCRKFET